MRSTGLQRRRLLDKLLREVSRAESYAIDAPVREARQLGDAPPVRALREVADHAAAMKPRFAMIVEGHDLAVQRPTIGLSLASLRNLVGIDRAIDAERMFHTALLDLRHGVDIVKLLREVARREMLFGIIRWCDDWLGARRTLVARVEAQLAWFAEQHALALGQVLIPAEAPHEASVDPDIEEDFDVFSSAADPEPRI